jgi:hypothetical protein
MSRACVGGNGTLDSLVEGSSPCALTNSATASCVFLEGIGDDAQHGVLEA